MHWLLRPLLPLRLGLSLHRAQHVRKGHIGHRNPAGLHLHSVPAALCPPAAAGIRLHCLYASLAAITQIIE